MFLILYVKFDQKIKKKNPANETTNKSQFGNKHISWYKEG